MDHSIFFFFLVKMMREIKVIWFIDSIEISQHIRTKHLTRTGVSSFLVHSMSLLDRTTSLVSYIGFFGMT